MKTLCFDYKKFPRKINMGCGFDIKKDFLNVDLHEMHGPDLVADCTDLHMLPSSYYEYIIAKDVLEHIPRLKTRSTLWEWNRLLKIDGILELQVPNVIGLLDLLTRDETQNMAQHEKLLQCLYGTQAYNGDFHFIGFTEITLNGLLSETGFSLKEIKIRDEWLFHVKAIKVENSQSALLFRGVDGMNHPGIDTETIKQRIRQEALRRQAALPVGKIEQGIEIFRSPQSCMDLKTKETWVWKLVKKVQHKLQKFPFYQLLYSVAAKFKGLIPKRYEFVNLNDLLPYQDEDFIRNAYRAILKREPDSNGFNDWLSRLRSGQLNKIEILGGMGRSEEGCKRNVKIKGLWLRYLINKSYKIPVAGYFIRVLTGIINLPKIIRTLNAYQAFTDARLAGKADREAVEELRPILAGKADREAVEELRPILAGKADREAVEELRPILAGKADSRAVEELSATTQDILRQVSEHRLNISDQQRRFILLLEDVRKRFPEPLSHEQIKSVLKEEDHILDAMYMVFEDRFRGTRAEIKRRLSVYLPHIDNMKIPLHPPLEKGGWGDFQTKSEKGGVSILDVGCGRGEWLELLQENGYRAKGIDINRVALLQCGEYGLDVTESDVIEYLKGLKRGSLDIITGFQILEHLPFKTLIALFDEALVVLKSGGMIIFETPNPANILVSSYDFYRDPSHIKPLHPDTLHFIAESRGFVRTGSYFVLDEGSDLKLIKSTEWMLSDINDYIKAPRDFALIGYKP
jgi:O-antigen chain-terminating methyltransferase